jgi:glycosyltransferase involved in cell wall biosynthesis
MRDHRTGILQAALESGWVGGAEAQMLELTAGLDRGAFEPVILTTPNGGGALIERARSLGLPVEVLPHLFLRRQFPFVGYYALGPIAVRALLRRRRVALLHTHCHSAAVPILAAATGMRLPLVYHVHDFDRRWVTSRTLRVLNRPRSLTVAVSGAVAKWVRDQGVDPQRIRTVYNGIQLAAFPDGAREHVRSSFEIGSHEIALVLPGRIEPRKGQEDLIRALADPVLRNLPIRAFFIGAPARGYESYDAAVRELVGELGLSDRVSFVGFRENVPVLLVGFDLAVLPSRREAFGRVVIESMHAGLPIVGYAEAGLPELVREGTDGFLVRSGDAAALAHQISVVASDAALRSRLGAAARSRAQEFSHLRFVARIEAIYRELLDDSPSPHE